MSEPVGLLVRPQELHELRSLVLQLRYAAKKHDLPLTVVQVDGGAVIMRKKPNGAA